MVRLFPLTFDFILKLNELWEKHWKHEYSLPDNKSCVVDAVAINDSGRIVGYGQVKMFAEAQLFLDPTCSKKDKVRSVRLLMQEAFRGADQAKLKDIYCFIRDPDFSLLIQKHFGFEKADDPGELLVRRL